MRVVSSCAFAVVLVSSACGSKGGGDGVDAGADRFESLIIEPGEARVTVPLGDTVTKGFLVYGVDGDQRTDITAGCGFTVDPAFATANGGSVTVKPHGGQTALRATCGARTVDAALFVTISGVVILGPDTPANAQQIFQGASAAVDVARTPTTVYPIDRAVAPVNLPPIDVQWSAAGNDLFHVALTSAFVTLDVYTTDVSAALSVGDWDDVAQSSAGTELTFTVEGLSRAAPTTRYVGAPVALTISHDAIDKTAIYYWASSAGNIMSQTFGATTAPELVRDSCTSCHSLSRAGTRLGYSRCVAGDCNELWAGFLRYDAPSARWVEAVNADDRTIRGSYTTFAPVGNPFPDDSQSLAIVSQIGGSLGLYDPDTGAAVPSNLTEVASHGEGAPRAALMADWSADGNTVAFASTPHLGQWIDLSDGAIATMSYSFAGGVHSFGEPRMLVKDPITLAGGVYNNFFFPSFSTDGALVVFNAARSAWRSNPAPAAGQRLMLTDAAGTWIKDLFALNGGAGDNDITWPHWAPESGGDYYWVVFSSERDYGHKVTAANSNPSCVANGVRQCKQIWIGAISKAALARGDADPSAAPVWLPGQDPGTTNISPFWTAGLIVN